ncbi:H+ Antiporter protein (plasmid) [Sporomusa termitida]|uniref:H+ Antiporter protein n=1 Tax=Sporomusa termitida TaxID=2377 RepID=A0A517E1J2_9FIRM|nr:H+ Antiporter protein [Sporomusa termitida]
MTTKIIYTRSRHLAVRVINWKKNIILFLGSQTISLFGSSLVQYAIMWYITLKTQSGIMMSISIVCSFLPTFFLSPFAGVWADRYNRKTLIILSDCMIAAATLQRFWYYLIFCMCLCMQKPWKSRLRVISAICAKALLILPSMSMLKPSFYFVHSSFFFAAPVAFLTPLQVTRSFGNDVWRLTAIDFFAKHDAGWCYYGFLGRF